jgi:hypothetical protein
MDATRSDGGKPAAPRTGGRKRSVFAHLLQETDRVRRSASGQWFVLHGTMSEQVSPAHHTLVRAAGERSFRRGRDSLAAMFLAA